MISDVDIRDWDKVDPKKALEVLEDLDDYARMAVSVEPTGPYYFMKQFIETVGEIRRSQMPNDMRRPMVL